jgi:uncharacterized protein YuzE
MRNATISYDKKNDVLYISIIPGVHSYAEEEVPGILIRKSIKDNCLTGITILDFKKRLCDSSIFSLNLPIEVDFNSIQCGLEN